MKKYLFINLYDAGEVRNKDFALCARRNRSVFDRIFVLSETPRKDEGMTNIVCGHTPTMRDLVDAANSRDGDVNAIANSDVWFESVPDFKGEAENVVYALTRYEADGSFFCRSDSADAWLFRGKLSVKDCNFRLGLRGTDNAFANRLRRAGYIVRNPSLDVRINHVHTVRRGKNWTYAPQPYDMSVRPESLYSECKLFLTSINPYDRVEAQAFAIGTWCVPHTKIVSLNTRREIKELRKYDEFKEVVFVACDNPINGKYQRLDDIWRTAMEIRADCYVLINSDICLLEELPKSDLWQRDGFIIAERIDSMPDGKHNPFRWGYDAFIMRRRHLEMLASQKTDFALGKPFHDFYTPLFMLSQGERVFVDRDHFLHRWHKTRYDYSSWVAMGEYARTVPCFVERGKSVQPFCTANKEYIEKRIEEI